MHKSKFAVRVAALVVTAAIGVSAAHAVDVEKKWRISLQAGAADTVSKAVSDAANQMDILSPTGDNTIFQRILDPRNDSAALGSLQINSAPRVMLGVQYAFTPTFILEATAGYQSGSVCCVEIQAQFDGVVIPDERFYLFDYTTIGAGDMEQIPLQVTALWRLRPRSNLNPYFGVGVGYTWVGFTPSDELDTLSLRMDESIGRFAGILDNGTFQLSGEDTNLTGSQVDAPDYFEWHAVAGGEYSFSRRWAMFLDVRYQFASTDFKLGFNGEFDLGSAVPNAVYEPDDPRANTLLYGPYLISEGGLVDGGQLVPTDENIPEEDWATYCDDIANECTFQPIQDGELDSGFYYAKGGKIKYGGWQFALGVRFTF